MPLSETLKSDQKVEGERPTSLATEWTAPEIFAFEISNLVLINCDFSSR